MICAAMEYRGATQTAAFQAIEERIRANTEAVLERVTQAGIVPRAAAANLALDGVRAAMKTRRFGIM
jgi:glutamate dehydrogenase (NAD(P)+)